MKRCLVVTFRGVCTHFRGIVPGVPHRVVLADASPFQFGLLDIPSENVNQLAYFLTPHLAEVRTTGEEDQRELTLPGSLEAGAVINGVRLQVANAVSAPLNYAGYCVQPLTEFVDDYVWSDDVVLGGRAALYFDLFGGEFSMSFGELGMHNVVVTIETDGDPQLLATPFMTPKPDACGMVPAPKVITLRGTAPSEAVQLSVGNISQACYGIGVEKQFDYLLHYLTAKNGIPRTLTQRTPGLIPGQMTQTNLNLELAQISRFHMPKGVKPLPAVPVPPSPFVIDIADSACSNSGYP